MIVVRLLTETKTHLAVRREEFNHGLALIREIQFPSYLPLDAPAPAALDAMPSEASGGSPSSVSEEDISAPVTSTKTIVFPSPSAAADRLQVFPIAAVTPAYIDDQAAVVHNDEIATTPDPTAAAVDPAYINDETAVMHGDGIATTPDREEITTIPDREESATVGGDVEITVTKIEVEVTTSPGDTAFLGSTTDRVINAIGKPHIHSCTGDLCITD